MVCRPFVRRSSSGSGRETEEGTPGLKYGFTDSSPFRELAVFLVLFAVCLLVARMPRVGCWLDPKLARLAAFLRRRGLFTVEEPWKEQRRLDLLRIAIGLMAAWRTGGNLLAAVAIGEPTTIALTAFAFALSLLVLLGLAAPVAALLLGVLINLIIDNLTQSSTLSSAVLAMVLMVMAFAPAGRSLSLDGLLLGRCNRLGRAWRALYAAFGPLTLDRAAVVKFGLLLAYASINFSSAMMHVTTQTWPAGMTFGWVLIHPLMSPRFFQIGEWIYRSSPAIYLAIAMLSTWATLLIQSGFLPLVLLDRRTRLLATLIESGFILGSILIIEVRMLGWYQAVALTILFWNRWKLNPAGRDSLSLSYDQRCVLCRRVVRVLSAIDLFGVIEICPEQADGEQTSSPGPAPDPPRRELIARDRAGRIHRGYDLWVVLAGRMLALLPLWPLLKLGQVLGLGSLLADLLAARHAALPLRGTGSTARPGRPDPLHGLPEMPAGSTLLRAFVLSFVVLLVAFFPRMLQPTSLVRVSLSPQPLHPSNWPGVAAAADLSRTVFGQAPLVFGMMQVNAFNFPPMGGQLGFVEVLRNRPSGPESMFSIPASWTNAPISDLTFYQSVIAIDFFQTDGLCLTRDSVSYLMNRPGISSIIRQQNVEPGELFIRVTNFDMPTMDDLRALRYVPLAWSPRCQWSVDAPSLQPTSMQLSLEGLNLIFANYKVPTRVEPAGRSWLNRFPCVAEAQRIGYWYNRLNDAGRIPADQAMVRRLVRDLRGKDPLLCFAEAEISLYQMNLNWSEANPPPGGDCAIDITAADAFYSNAFHDALRARTQADLERAVAAWRQGNTLECLEATANVRRAYIEQLASPRTGG